MPGKCKFQEIWLEDVQLKKWLRRNGTDIYSAFCTYCKKSFDISHSGINSVKLHSKGKHHASIESNLLSGKQMTLHCFQPKPRPSTSSVMPSCSDHSGPSTTVEIDRPACTSHGASPPGLKSYVLSESVARAEILWAAYCVTSNTSTRNGALAIDMFSLMFPDSTIAPKLQLQKDKISYSVTYGLGPYCSSIVASNARKSPFFALSIDESLNDICQKQQMDIMINYWDFDEGIVRTRYLTSAFLERSSALNMLEEVTSCIAGANLSLNDLVQLSTDGPNVNLKLIFDLKQHMKESLESQREILDLGTCSLHIINGAYKTAHDKVGWRLNQFLRGLYRLFKNYPSRRSVFCQITGCKTFPKKFCAVRWTENSSVIRRSIELLPYLKNYVLNITEPPATENFVLVKEFLADPVLEAKLHFTAMLSEELEEFLTIFQKNSPLLPFLHQEVFSLMMSLANKFIKNKIMASVTNASRLKKIDITNIDNLKNVENIDVGFGASAAIKKVREIHAQKFKLDCKQFLTEMFKKLLDKSPLNKKPVLGASAFNPEVMLNDTLRASRIKVAIEAFIDCAQISPSDGDIIMREYLKFCQDSDVKEKLQDFNWKNERLDKLFSTMFKGKNINEKLKLLIQRILICFHGNAAVERSFSFNKNFLVENLQEKSLIAQRALHDHIISLEGGLKSLDVTKQMVLEFRNASSRRVEDLKRKKEEEDKATFEKKQIQKELRELKLKRQRILEEKSEELSAIDNKLKILKKSF